MGLTYVMPRLIRHFMPEFVVRFLLRRGLFIKPGLETQDPEGAVERYIRVLAGKGMSLSGKRVLVFGYGGNFWVGVRLLQASASHVVLHDKFAMPEDKRNRQLLDEYGKYLVLERNRVWPNPLHITLLRGDLEPDSIPPVDIILSNSVFEHLPRTGVDEITRSLAHLTNPGGVNLHFIDLRDHFFLYPFEMLSYSETTWRRWLNPTSNLNRLRFCDYERLFHRHFDDVEITITGRDLAALETARPRIRPEFLSGDPQVDSVTLISVLTASPRK